MQVPGGLLDAFGPVDELVHCCGGRCDVLGAKVVCQAEECACDASGGELRGCDGVQIGEELEIGVASSDSPNDAGDADGSGTSCSCPSIPTGCLAAAAACCSKQQLLGGDVDVWAGVVGWREPRLEKLRMLLLVLRCSLDGLPGCSSAEAVACWCAQKIFCDAAEHSPGCGCVVVGQVLLELMWLPNLGEVLVCDQLGRVDVPWPWSLVHCRHGTDRDGVDDEVVVPRARDLLFCLWAEVWADQCIVDAPLTWVPGGMPMVEEAVCVVSDAVGKQGCCCAFLAGCVEVAQDDEVLSGVPEELVVVWMRWSRSWWLDWCWMDPVVRQLMCWVGQMVKGVRTRIAVAKWLRWMLLQWRVWPCAFAAFW
eukprot:s6007_g5.t1